MNNKTTKTFRLNKALSMLGICSRRDADKLIQAGQVYVNGQKIEELGFQVSEKDEIKVKDKFYNFKSKKTPKVWLYYKPVGLVTTHKDEKSRPTVFDDLRNKINERVISVGRLDLNSEGLLILTNNSDFARRAENPKTALERHYRVRCFGDFSENMKKSLEEGLTIDGIKYAPLAIKSIRKTNGKNFWLEMILKEGKNREIRKLLGYFGIQVNRLIRTEYGPYKLDNLKPGEVVKAEIDKTLFKCY